MYIPTLYALEHFSDQSAFERLALDILNLSGNGVAVPMANRGGGDGGQDIVYTNPSGEKSCVFVSLEKKGLAKFKKDAAKHKKGEYKEYSYFTTSYITYASKKKITKVALEELDAIIHIYDIETLRSLLDTLYTGLRSEYLGIDSVIKSSYEIVSSRSRKYSAIILEKYGQDLYTKTREKFLARSNVANVIPVSLMGIGVRSTQNVLDGIKDYQQKVDQFNKSLSNLYSFNLTIQTDTYDENVEVQITSTDDIIFGFEDRSLEKPTEPDLSEQSDIFRSINRISSLPMNMSPQSRNKDEFYATVHDSGKLIKSKIATINPNQLKTLFDEPIFFKNPKGLREIKINYIVYSKNSKAINQDFLLEMKDAELIEFTPASNDYE